MTLVNGIGAHVNLMTGVFNSLFKNRLIICCGKYITFDVAAR